MAPDTENAVFKINTKIVGALMAMGAMAIGVIMWFARLEYRTESNRDDNVRMSAAIETVRNDRARDNDRITRAESQLTFILQGIEEIKGLLKERERKGQ